MALPPKLATTPPVGQQNAKYKIQTETWERIRMATLKETEERWAPRIMFTKLRSSLEY